MPAPVGRGQLGGAAGFDLGAGEQLERRRRRHRQAAVRGVDGAAAERHAPRGDARRAQPGERRRGADDVDDRVDRADLVERDVLDGDAVQPRLDDGDAIEDVERARAHVAVEVLLQHRLDVAIVLWLVVRVAAVVRARRVRGARGRGDA